MIVQNGFFIISWITTAAGLPPNFVAVKASIT